MPEETLTSNQLLAKQYLEELDFSDISSKTKKSLTMSKKFIVNGIPREIVTYISCNFPLEYPKFFINDTSFYLIYPHIELSNIYENSCSICLINEEEKILYKNPTELLQMMYNALVKFFTDINDGTLKQKDIYDEFDSYWRGKFILHYNKGVLANYKKFKAVDAYFLEGKNKNFAIVDYIDKLKSFNIATNGKLTKGRILYLNFEKKFPNKIPQTYNDFIEVLKDIGYLNLIKKLKKDTSLHRIILFSFLIPNSRKKHFASIYIDPTKEEYLNKTGIINILLNSKNSDKKLYTGFAKDINPNRIYTRGGNSNNMKINSKDKNIVIIGCGSIGASLAYKLNKIGCSNLLLIDPDGLSIDNISRHLLGMEYEQENKAIALKNFLEKQFFSSNIKAIEDRVEHHLDKLKSHDLLITALGSEANHIEELIVNKSIDGELPPVISCWLEANAIAGHSIYFDNMIDSSSFDMQTIFSNITILEKEYAASLKKDDVGCNSSYMPYSFINADLHINHFANMVIDKILGNKTPAIYTSIANISGYEEYIKKGIAVNSNTLMMKDF
jgi:hypothetical protein